jgi:hypothetical protein
LSIIVHGTFLFMLFLVIFWGLNSLQSLHEKVDEIPGSGAGVATILAQLRADRASLHGEIEGLRFQLDPLSQSLDYEKRDRLNLEDRLTKLLTQYDSLLALVEKNARQRVDFPHSDTA